MLKMHAKAFKHLKKFPLDYTLTPVTKGKGREGIEGEGKRRKGLGVQARGDGREGLLEEVGSEGEKGGRINGRRHDSLSRPPVLTCLFKL
jgi:hypothetical protein